MSDLATLEARIARAEAAVTPPVRPGCEARVIWAEGPVRTDIALVYVHGFSASPEETRPVPDRVAAALGANLHFVRLTGHGQDGQALARATLADWKADIAAALEVGRAIGRRTLLMGCSTGCTLITLALAEGAEAAGVIHISPNFAMASPLVQWAIDAPGVRWWGPRLMGRERAYEVISAAHEAYWTPRYPTEAILPMADAVRAVRRADLGRIEAPALFAYCPADKIVSPAATRRAMARWGGPTEAHLVTMGPGDDANGHVIAGDIFSPGQTDGVVAAMVDWAGRTLR